MRSIAVSFFLLLAGSASAQCGMTTEIVMNVNCDQATTWVNTTGGQGPYTLVIERYTGNYYVTEITTTDADGDLSMALPLNVWGYSYGARVTVTDVASCTATDLSDYYWSVENGWLNTPSSQLDCTNGVSRAVVVLLGSSTPPTYTISPGTTGSFLADWTSLGSNSWRLNTPLTNGSYLISFPQYMETNVGINCADAEFVTINNVTPGDCGVNFRLRAALDGALPSGTTMTDGLRNANLIPAIEPYTGLGYNFVGSSPGVSLAPGLLSVTGNSAIVDWVVVELRSTTAPHPVLYSKAALIRRDGFIADPDGDVYINCPVATGSYRIALRHRNHLGVMTSLSTDLGTNPFTNGSLYDFRTQSVYGTNARVLKNGIYCLWAGDATGDGTIKYVGAGNDRDAILLSVGGSTPNNSVNNVYDRRDTNLDGAIKYTGVANDRDVILTNVGSTTPNNTRTQQLP